MLKGELLDRVTELKNDINELWEDCLLNANFDNENITFYLEEMQILCNHILEGE